MDNKIPPQWNDFYLKDVSFVNLMMRRIYNVLIVANPYDAFMLEDDGRIEEKIYKLQQRKKSLIDQMIQPGETFLAKLTDEEIAALFEK